MKQLTSEVLLARTKSLVAEERRITLALIEHLEEIQARMLYAKLGYSSLWEFATCELGLSEGAAQRRIQAMRLVRDVPEAKTALENGKLSLSNAAKVQSFRQAEKKLGRKVDALQLVAQVHNLTQRECEKTLFEISPQALPREHERMVSAAGERELTIVISPDLHAKLQQLKGLLAHSMPDTTYAQLIERMTEEMLTRIEKKKGSTLDAATALTAAAAVNQEKPLPSGRRVYLPAKLRRAVWARGQSQCEVEQGGRRCSAQHRLEIDHVIPLVLGGSNHLDNLRLACWHHNQQQAREKIIQRKRDSISSLRHSSS